MRKVESDGIPREAIEKEVNILKSFKHYQEGGNIEKLEQILQNNKTPNGKQNIIIGIVAFMIIPFTPVIESCRFN